MLTPTFTKSEPVNPLYKSQKGDRGGLGGWDLMLTKTCLVNLAQYGKDLFTVLFLMPFAPPTCFEWLYSTFSLSWRIHF